MLIVSIGSIWIATASPIVVLSAGRAWRAFWRSVQSFLEPLEQRRGAPPRRGAAVAAQEFLERRDRRAVTVEMGVEQSGFAPQLGAVGREQQHALNDGEGL